MDQHSYFSEGDEFEATIAKAVSLEFDKLLPHVVQALKVDRAHDELVGRLNEAEKRLQARDVAPLIGRVRHILLAVRKNEYSPELRDWIVGELEATLSGSGFLEFGEVGETFDPARHEAVVGQAEGSTGVVVTGVVAPGLETLGDVVVKASVEVGSRIAGGDKREGLDIDEGSNSEQGRRD